VPLRLLRHLYNTCCTAVHFHSTWVDICSMRANNDLTTGCCCCCWVNHLSLTVSVAPPTHSPLWLWGVNLMLWLWWNDWQRDCSCLTFGISWSWPSFSLRPRERIEPQSNAILVCRRRLPLPLSSQVKPNLCLCWLCLSTAVYPWPIWSSPKSRNLCATESVVCVSSPPISHASAVIFLPVCCLG